MQPRPLRRRSRTAQASRRHRRDGSNQMSDIIVVTAFLGFGPCSDGFLREAGLTFLGGAALSRLWGRRHRQAGRGLTWSVVAPEPALGAGLVVFLPSPWAWLLLAWGASFHVATAVMMGLNSFVWAFIAIYPALIYMHTLLHAG
jgi:hypothetical protein